MKNSLSGNALDYVRQRLSIDSGDRKGKLIAIEGLDGVGKTTTARNVAEILNGTALSSPIASIHKTTRASIDELAFTDPLTRFQFYFDANQYDSEHVLRPAMEQDRTIILDRFITTTIVAHEALGADLNSDPRMSRPNDTNDIVIPDATIYLNLDNSERIRRLQKRNETVPNTKLDIDVALQNRMASIYNQLTRHGLIDIDINGLDPEQVCGKIIDMLGVD